MDAKNPPDVTATVNVLLRQYELLEQRRRQFGGEFMQTFAFFFATFAALVGLLGKNHNTLFRIVLFYAGLMFSVVSYLAHRLGKRQDDCEAQMAVIEERLRQECGINAVTCPRGARGVGARQVVVLALILLSLSLLAISVFWL